MPKRQTKTAKQLKANISIQDKIKHFYSQSLRRYYLVMFAGFFIGAKLCDFIFYDAVKLEILRQQMEDQFWTLNGEPKHLKPQLVPSHQDPSKIRKSWIQIVYGKDTYVPKQA